MLKRKVCKNLFLVLLLILQAIVPTGYASTQVSTDLHVHIAHGIEHGVSHNLDQPADHEPRHDNLRATLAGEQFEPDHSHDHCKSSYFVALVDDLSTNGPCHMPSSYIQAGKVERVSSLPNGLYRPPRSAP